ncbi:hypothetical protein N0V90_001116 [Kalmusia sp. IMI 367209]|nr:hypothetical protein N0V90_001116 [Kalmusia sp. IMI 367209]
MPRAAKKRSQTTTTYAPAPKRTRRGANTASTPDIEESPNVKELISKSEITLANQQQSPLLRLPLELRELIWTYAFGSQVVHPISDRHYLARSKVGRIRYYACREKLSDQDVYALSLQGASERDKELYAAKNLYPAQGYHACGGGPDTIGDHAGLHEHCVPHDPNPDKAVRFGPPPVCKQLYYEAMPLAWKTTTFCFTECVSFEDFVATRSIRKDLIEQLTIRPSSFRNGWDAALTPAAVASFTALQGLHLVFCERRWYSSPRVRPPLASLDLLKSFPSQQRHVPNLIKQFQQLKLKEERTTVLVPSAWRPGQEQWPVSAIDGIKTKLRFDLAVEERVELAGLIRKKLLDYKPRRMGRSRGARR